MTDELEDMLDRVSRYIAKKYYGHSELDDLMQEGKIAVWRAWTDGERNKQQLIWKAMNRAGDLLKLGQPFGKPRADRVVDRKQGQATREKLRAFIAEYVLLHDRQPTYREMGEACGISIQGVSVHLKRLYLFSGAAESMVVLPFDRFPDPEALDIFAVDPGFVDKTIDRLMVREMMETLPEKERYAIYLRFWEDKTFPAIAKELGFTNSSSGENWVKRGLTSLKATVT